jgi:hypothetical protein
MVFSVSGMSGTNLQGLGFVLADGDPLWRLPVVKD